MTTYIAYATSPDVDTRKFKAFQRRAKAAAKTPQYTDIPGLGVWSIVDPDDAMIVFQAPDVRAAARFLMTTTVEGKMLEREKCVVYTEEIEPL